MTNSGDQLKTWMALRDQSQAQIQTWLGSAARNRPNSAYQNLSGVTELHNAAVHPGWFYFTPDGKFALLYVGDAAALQGLSAAALHATFGKPADELRSRAGKTATHNVYPEAGLAFTEQDGKVALLEIFPTTTLADYKARIYLDPGAFTR